MTAPLAQGQEIEIAGPKQQQSIVKPPPKSTAAMLAEIRTDAFKSQLEAALPETITVDHFTRVTASALLANPDLADKASPDSIVQSIIRCAQDGLYPDGNEAALVIFKGKAQYMPMIGGFRKIAAEYGWTIRGAVIYENDEFEYTLGDQPSVTHKPPKLGVDRGGMVGAYASARHRDGRFEFLVMSDSEIAKVQNVSRAKDAGPWKDWPERMWEKTPARRLFKQLSLDPGDRRIASLVASEDFEPQAALETMYGPSGEPYVARELEAAVDASEASVQEAPSEEVSPMPEEGASALEEPSAAADGEGEAVREQPAADGKGPESAPTPAPDPSPTDEEEPVIEGAETIEAEAIDEDEFTPEEAAQLPAALEARIPSGSYQQRTLAYVFALGAAADQWLTYALRQPWPKDPAFHQALVLACRAERPDLYHAWRDEA